MTIDQNNSLRFELDVLRKERGLRRMLDIGGPFLSEEIRVSEPTHVVESWKHDTFYGMDDNIDAHVHVRNFPQTAINGIANGVAPLANVEFVSTPELKGYGGSGIARTLPTTPEMGVTRSVIELVRDGLPSLIGRQFTRERNLQSAGSEYLNYQFGISPIVSDIQDLLSITRDAEKTLRQFRRDNNRVVRRGTTLVDEKDIVSSSVAADYAYSGSQAGNDLRSVLYSPSVRNDLVRSRRVWFSGAYSLAYPLSLDDSLKEITEFNRLYGVIPTAELVWDLIPFSWLVDWFLNVGDVLRNVSTLGSNLQLRYGYIMAEESYERRYSGSFGPNYLHLRNRDLKRVDLLTVVRHSRKRRLKASPFGFSVQFSDLDNGQKAILTALGLSRQRVM